jgi:hypothetical protein
MLLDCFQAIPKPLIALAGSVVLGGIFMYLWSEMLHARLQKQFPDVITEKDRVLWVAMLGGALNRSFMTTVVIWLPQATGPIAALLVSITAVLGWGHLNRKTTEGRARFNVSVMNGIASIFWAIAWGIWGMPLQA